MKKLIFSCTLILSFYFSANNAGMNAIKKNNLLRANNERTEPETKNHKDLSPKIMRKIIQILQIREQAIWQDVLTVCGNEDIDSSLSHKSFTRLKELGLSSFLLFLDVGFITFINHNGTIDPSVKQFILEISAHK